MPPDTALFAALAAALERAPRAMLVVDGDGTVRIANRAARTRFDLVVGRALAAAVTSNRAALEHGLAQARRLSRSVPLLLRLDGRPAPFYAWRMDPIDERAAPLVVLKEDTTKAMAARLNTAETGRTHAERRLSLTEVERDRLRRVARRLEQLAETDHLTGLLNAQAFARRAAELLAADGRGAFVYVDLDFFKPINDLYGHDAGDRLLQEIARRLDDVAGPAGLAARLGGDEFALWMPRLAADTVGDFAADLSHVLERPITLHDGCAERPLSLSVGASVGVSATPEGGADIDTLRNAAEGTMYAVKARRHAGSRAAALAAPRPQSIAGTT